MMITTLTMTDPTVARFSRGAGATGLVANGQAGRPTDGQVPLGPLNDAIGSVSTALRSRWRWPSAGGRCGSWDWGVMTVLTVAGPALPLDPVPFEIQMPIAAAAFLVLAGWLVMVNRRGNGLPRRVARLGVWCGGGVLGGAVVVGSGFLLPWMSWPQLAVFGLGGLAARSGERHDSQTHPRHAEGGRSAAHLRFTADARRTA